MNSKISFPGFTFSLLFLFIFFATSGYSVQHSGKRYYIDEISIQAAILPDGSLKIEESRTYRFQGRFTWAYYKLPLQNIGQVSDFSLAEEGILYLESDSHEPGTFQLKQTENELLIKWYYEAKDETRTFTINYRVEDVVIVHQDVAEFYYKFLGKNRDKTAGQVFVTLSLPHPADTTKVRAWLHSSLNGKYSFQNGYLKFEASPLPRKNFFEVRVMFPPEWTPQAHIKTNKLMRDKIFAEEKLLVDESNRLRKEARRREIFKRKHQQNTLVINLLLTGLGIFVFIMIYQRYGKAHPVPFRGRISSDIPENISPAMANFIFTAGQLNASAILATLIDLASRGFLQIKEEVLHKKFLTFNYQKKQYRLILNREKFEKEHSQLLPHEENLLSFLFNDLCQGGSEIFFDEIRNSRSKVRKWFLNWKKIIKQEWGGKPIYDKVSIKATIAFAVISLLILIAGILTLPGQNYQPLTGNF